MASPTVKEMETMIRRSLPQSEIRQELRRDGIHLMSEHGHDKVKNYLCSPQEVITGVFLEELDEMPPDQEPPLRPSREIVSWRMDTMSGVY
ncbi:MAG: hypothetical protein HGA96_05195 [Desulfobulbaceae bacterium]|nr:hypothetical protein [Desulfobulbaceae bacterium]